MNLIIRNARVLQTTPAGEVRVLDRQDAVEQLDHQRVLVGRVRVGQVPGPAPEPAAVIPV